MKNRQTTAYIQVAWLVWGERFGMISLLGAAVVVTAGVLVMRELDTTEKNSDKN